MASNKGGAWIARLNKVSTDYCQSKSLGAISVQNSPTSPEATEPCCRRRLMCNMRMPQLQSDIRENRAAPKISSQQMIYPVVVGLAVNKDNPELLKELKASLAQRVSDGSYRALLQKYNLQMPGPMKYRKRWQVVFDGYHPPEEPCILTGVT
ncbi:hypothetical protein ACVXG7_25675 [Enterobacter hormaechei]